MLPKVKAFDMAIPDHLRTAIVVGENVVMVNTTAITTNSRHAGTSNRHYYWNDKL